MLDFKKVISGVIITAGLVMLLFLILLFCFGCKYVEEEQASMVLEEPAAVVDVVYAPATHGSGVGVGFGVSSGGNVTTTVAPIFINTKETRALVFQCQHGKFIVNCNTRERLKMWNILREGDDVIVHYKEVWRLKRERKSKRVVEQHLEDYWFLDAVKVK